MSVAAILLLAINNYPLGKRLANDVKLSLCLEAWSQKTWGPVKYLSVQVTSSGAMFSLSGDEGVGPIGA